jgi:hypothetical protein
MLGASALLLLGVAMSLSVEQIAPVVRELQRETATERAAVRELAASLAKAVRQLSGTDFGHQHPGRPQNGGWADASAPKCTAPIEPLLGPARVRQPRVALLNLPPPPIA